MFGKEHHCCCLLIVTQFLYETHPHAFVTAAFYRFLNTADKTREREKERERETASCRHSRRRLCIFKRLSCCLYRHFDYDSSIIPLTMNESDHFTFMCRLCLFKSPDNVDIFSEESVKRGLHSQIQLLFSVSVRNACVSFVAVF